MAPQYLPLRKVAYLLCVLSKARAIPGVDDALEAQLKLWSDRDGVSVSKIATASLSAEEDAYIASISPLSGCAMLRNLQYLWGFSWTKSWCH